jgi:hypothetical protein
MTTPAARLPAALPALAHLEAEAVAAGRLGGVYPPSRDLAVPGVCRSSADGGEV